MTSTSTIGAPPARTAAGSAMAPTGGALAAPATASSSEVRASRSGATNPAHSAAAAQAPARILRVGSTGPAVLALKTELRKLHYTVDSGPRYTDATKHAVMAFQKVNGLGRDGVAGPQTQRAMDNPKKPNIGTGERERVVVDLSDQVILVVHRGKLSKIVSATSGNPNARADADGGYIATPKGTFRVQRKINGPDPVRGGEGILYHPSYFRGGVAVHGSAGVGPYPASHGCVRIPMHLSKRLHDEMPVGMQVKVRQ